MLDSHGLGYHLRKKVVSGQGMLAEDAEIGKVNSPIRRVKIWAKKDFKPNGVGLCDILDKAEKWLPFGSSNRVGTFAQSVARISFEEVGFSWD